MDSVGYVLIVAGSPTGVPASLLHGLVPGARLVVAADSGVASLMRAGERCDLLVGDLDSAPVDATSWALDRDVEVLRVPPEKDYTDLELAFDVIRHRGGGPVVLCGACGGRLDHQLAVVGAVGAADDLSPVIVEEGLVAALLGGRGRSDILLTDLGIRPGDTFSLVAPVAQAVVSETGVRYPLDHHVLGALSGLGVSNVADDTDARVTCHEGKVLVLSCGA